jgi:hypothetical protein
MLNLFNSKAQLDLAVIDPAEVAKLDDNQQAHLASLINAAKVRETAQERLSMAQAAVIDASREQAEALEAHAIANPPPTQLEATRAAQAAYAKSL